MGEDRVKWFNYDHAAAWTPPELCDVFVHISADDERDES